MRSTANALLIVVAMVFGGYASQTLASETPPISSDYREDCVVDEQSDCAERCLTEHNCCIKSCNWVRAKDKSKCIKHCKSVLNRCYNECDETPAAEGKEESPQPDSRSEPVG